MKKRQFTNYQDKLLQDLQDPEMAQEYLNIALLDEDPRIFLLALKNVCAAKEIPMTDIAKKANISRENVYRILSKTGNPKLNNIISLLSAVGFSLSIQSINKR